MLNKLHSILYLDKHRDLGSQIPDPSWILRSLGVLMGQSQSASWRPPHPSSSHPWLCQAHCRVLRVNTQFTWLSSAPPPHQQPPLAVPQCRRREASSNLLSERSTWERSMQMLGTGLKLMRQGIEGSEVPCPCTVHRGTGSWRAQPLVSLDSMAHGEPFGARGQGRSQVARTKGSTDDSSHLPMSNS